MLKGRAKLRLTRRVDGIPYEYEDIYIGSNEREATQTICVMLESCDGVM
jgi:hypothetical protein